jgi:ribosomal protein L39E
MLHILPEKFVRIRHYGFLSNKTKARKIKLIKTLIAGQPVPVTEVKTEVKTEANTTPETKESKIKTKIICPFCKIGTLQKGAVVRPVIRIRRALRVFSN